MRIPFYYTLLFPSLVLAAHPAASVSRPLTVQKIEDALSAEKATNQESVLKWVRDSQMKNKPGSDSSSELLIATTKSESSAGKNRLVFSRDYGQSIFSFFQSGKMELLVDTESAEGFKPYVLKPNKSGQMRAEATASCQTCHGSDFTPIWRLETGLGFFTHEDSSFRPPLNSVLHLVYDRANGNLNNVLIKRAASNLFDKISVRHPGRFKKHAPLLLKLLMRCGVAEAQWNELLTDIRKEAPGLLPLWKPIFDGWEKHIADLKAAGEDNARQGYTSIEGSLRPLLLVHFLGVPPQNILLPAPLKEEAKLFDSIENFSQLNDPAVGGLSKRWGPLGAYAGENDDVRGHLAARLAYQVFPGIDYSISNSDAYKHSDIGAFLTIKPDLAYVGEKRERHSDYLADQFFLFNIYGVYDITVTVPDSKPPPQFVAGKKKWCEQLTSGNADFGALGVSLGVPQKQEYSTHEKKTK